MWSGEVYRFDTLDFFMSLARRNNFGADIMTTSKHTLDSGYLKSQLPIRDREASTSSIRL